MCGIFSILTNPKAKIDQATLLSLTNTLFLLSESRGREAAGIAVKNASAITVYKLPKAASQFIHDDGYKNMMQSVTLNQTSISIIGHARLVTNGRQTLNENNQPIANDHCIAVHNGIIVNDKDLWNKELNTQPQTQLDSEALIALLSQQLNEGQSIDQAIINTYQKIKGSASLLTLFTDYNILAAATNTGSLYSLTNQENTLKIFASEKYILEQLLTDKHFKNLLNGAEIQAVLPNQCQLIDLNSLEQLELNLKDTQTKHSSIQKTNKISIQSLSQNQQQWVSNLKRCSRCILPETMPFIEFDDNGVCNYCHNHVNKPLLDKQELEEKLAPYRSRSKEPDCIVAFSGGRDSCYGLYYLKKVLGMNPIAFTYDWGLVTDIARRNQARVCGELGIEHIIISADIRKKRRFIKHNIEAWLKRPELGMVPLFTAGDKMYYYYANQLQKRTGIKLLVMCENGRLEQTRFKSGFCGINEGNRRLFNLSFAEKIKLASYYSKQVLRNPSYFNRSIWDSLKAFLASYFIKHDYLFLFDYIPWEESTVNQTLKEEFDWELAKDTQSTWRIGDGTAAFYNYIYYTIAGFTEHDTFRSNQIRYQQISREEALEKIVIDNLPRWETFYDYANTIGFDADLAIQTINASYKAKLTQ